MDFGGDGKIKYEEYMRAGSLFSLLCGRPWVILYRMAALKSEF